MSQALGVVADVLSSGKATPESLPWASLRYQHTQAVRAVLADRYAPATANKALSALRGVLGECFRLGLMSAEDHARATDLPNVKGHSAPRGRALKTGELVALFGACDATTAQGARDAALLAVLYGAGLRRAEVVTLDLADFDPDSGELRIRSARGASPGPSTSRTAPAMLSPRGSRCAVPRPALCSSPWTRPATYDRDASRLARSTRSSAGCRRPRR